MSKKASMVASSEDEWRAEGDASTLERAAEILADPERKKRAEKFLQKRAKGMEKLEEMGLKCCIDD